MSEISLQIEDFCSDFPLANPKLVHINRWTVESIGVEDDTRRTVAVIYGVIGTFPLWSSLVSLKLVQRRARAVAREQVKVSALATGGNN